MAMTKKEAAEYRAYVKEYPDLVAAAEKSGKGLAQFGKQHYEKHGKKEGRTTPKQAEQKSYSSKPAQQASSVNAANKTQKAKGNVFAGTNIPLSAIKDKDQRADFQRRLAADISDGNARGANDVIFSIAYAAGGNKGQGNPNVGAVQSGVWKLDNGPYWAETAINSEND